MSKKAAQSNLVERCPACDEWVRPEPVTDDAQCADGPLVFRCVECGHYWSRFGGYLRNGRHASHETRMRWVKYARQGSYYAATFNNRAQSKRVKAREQLRSNAGAARNAIKRLEAFLNGEPDMIRALSTDEMARITPILAGEDQ